MVLVLNLSIAVEYRETVSALSRYQATPRLQQPTWFFITVNAACVSTHVHIPLPQELF